MPSFKWASENIESIEDVEYCVRAWAMWYISVSRVMLCSRYCHSMKCLCYRGFVFVQWLTGACQTLATLICHHLHVEHTGGSLLLLWNAGSVTWHSGNLQTAKVNPCANTHGYKRCTQIRIPRENLSFSVLLHVFILAVLMSRVVSGILSGPSDLVVQPSSPFDPQETHWAAPVLI